MQEVSANGAEIVTSGSVSAMRREFSAGAVLVRRLRGDWVAAAIRPQGKSRGIWALPKGLVGPGEEPAAAALREVEEETGVRGRLVRKLGDVRYVYTWAGERVFKVVSFYLVRYSAGRLGDLAPEFVHEVAETRWIPLARRSQHSSPTRVSGRWRRRRSRL